MKPTDKISEFAIKGMHCMSCVNKVTQALNPVAEKVSVSLTPPIAILLNSNATITQINQALESVGDYNATQIDATKVAEPPVSNKDNKSWLETYKPLFLIVGYILLTTIAINFLTENFDIKRWMMHFMAGFFLVFSFFKMLDIKAFASSYAMYDLLAMRIKAYGLIYPFIELALGLAYLLGFTPKITNYVTLIIMGFSGLGVIRAVMNKQKIRCACLGTVFELPMSTITIIEDLLMAGMALWMLV